MDVDKMPEESVWDYPRPPLIQANSRRLRILFNGKVVADSTRGFRICETSHPPTYYIPMEDFNAEYLRRIPGKRSFCEWKGVASYYDIVVGDREANSAAWCYESPSAEMYLPIKNHVAVYASKVDECYVDSYKVTPQEGDFYGGWITSNISGGKKGIKGGPGTWGW